MIRLNLKLERNWLVEIIYKWRKEWGKVRAENENFRIE